MVKFPAKAPSHPSKTQDSEQNNDSSTAPEVRSDAPACGWRTIISLRNPGLAAHSGLDKSLWRKASTRQMGCTRMIPCINTLLSHTHSQTHTALQPSTETSTLLHTFHEHFLHGCPNTKHSHPKKPLPIYGHKNKIPSRTNLISVALHCFKIHISVVWKAVCMELNAD